MKNQSVKSVVFTIIALAVLLLSGTFFYLYKLKKAAEPGNEFAESIKWYTYAEGVPLGKGQGKKIVLLFYADWCAFCEKMDKETFRDDPVVVYMNENFIAVRVNSDREPKLAAEYLVRGLPTTWFLTADGQKISSLPGYISPKQFLKFLRFTHSDSYKSMSFKKFLQHMQI